MLQYQNNKKDTDMKIKILFIALALGMGITAFAKEAKIDTKKSKVLWDGKKVTGSGHNGYVIIKEGSLTMADNKITSGKIVVDMNTIVNTDGKDGEPTERLVKHLKSDDFFGVEEFPTAEFVITGSGEFQNGEAQVYGRMTIKGKTEQLQFKAKKDGKVLTTTFEIQRAPFGISYGLADKVQQEHFTLDITLVLK